VINFFCPVGSSKQSVSSRSQACIRFLVLTGRLDIALEKISWNLDFLNAQNDPETLRLEALRGQLFLCCAPFIAGIKKRSHRSSLL